jgi:Icc-related predicted phosphoesterase
MMWRRPALAASLGRAPCWRHHRGDEHDTGRVCWREAGVVKLQLISDLHTEFYQGPKHVFRNVEIVPDLDFLVVAGDSVVFSSQPDQTVKPVFKFFAEHARHVVLVEGNHEYYTAISSERIQQRMGNMVARYKNVHWLRNSEIKLDGVHFFGGCMWFPDRDGLNQMYENKIADFSQIKDLGHWVYSTNKEFTDRALELVRRDTIVVSHHLPHARSTPEVFRGDQLNRFFVSDQTKLIEEKQPRLWLHGHSHVACDYSLGNTRVVCNPYGYPHERNGRPYPQVVLEIPGRKPTGVIA